MLKGGFWKREQTCKGPEAARAGCFENRSPGAQAMGLQCASVSHRAGSNWPLPASRLAWRQQSPSQPFPPSQETASKRQKTGRPSLPPPEYGHPVWNHKMHPSGCDSGLPRSREPAGSCALLAAVTMPFCQGTFILPRTGFAKERS